jgi:hypothetical protein
MCLPLGPNFAGSNPAKTMNFEGDKNPQHTFVSDGKQSRKVQSSKNLRNVK